MPDYLNAFLKRRFRAGGARLRPLCALHLIYLEALGHPLVRGEVPTPAAAALAVQLLAERPERLLDDPGAVLARLESRTVRRWWRLRCTVLGGRRRTLLELLAHWAAHWNLPEFLPPRVEVRAGTAGKPPHQEKRRAPLALALVAEAGGGRDAYLAPVDRLAWEAAALAEADPDKVVRLKTAEDEEWERKAAEWLAADREKREGAGNA